MADYKKAKLEAEKIWNESYYNTLPLPIIEVAQNNGLKILEVNLEGNNDVSGFLDVNKKIIYLNKEDSVEHKRFTVAHELGHLKLHYEQLQNNSDLGVYYRRPIGGETDDKEKEANCFAANLLVPLDQLKKFISSCSDLELAQIFAVSLQVIGYRKKYLAEPALNG